MGSLHIPQSEYRVGAAHWTVLSSSHSTVIGPMMDSASEGERGGEGGDRDVEEELPYVPQAEQVQVA